MTPSEQQIFFTLLRASIFQRPADLSLFSLPDWTWAPICRSLESHSLLALAADAIIPINDQLPPSKRLSPIQLMAIYKHSATVAQTHFELNQAVADIFELLKDFNPILLKGQGLSTIYPNQNTRSCGDIDIYIGKENYLQAKSLLNTLCSEAEIHSAQEDPHQYHITHGKITYELHPVAGFSAVSFHQKKYEDWASQQLNPSNCDFATLNLQDHQSYEIRVPNHQFNIPYLFDHLCRHLRFQGVGVRQFIDIVLLLHQANQDATFLNTLKQDLQRLGIFRAWQILSGIFVYNLGLPPSECPFFNPRKAQKSQTNLLQAILTDSNFGFQTSWRHQEELQAYNAHRVLSCYRQQFHSLRINYSLFPLFSLYEFLRQTTRTLFIACGLKKSEENRS